MIAPELDAKLTADERLSINTRHGEDELRNLAAHLCLELQQLRKRCDELARRVYIQRGNVPTEAERLRYVADSVLFGWQMELADMARATEGHEGAE